ncbi:MAG: hypothetical protein O7D94_04290, partial [Planctomycetota bacterium]|nr:hypothetical protein [Planctomycetota bacterium]
GFPMIAIWGVMLLCSSSAGPGIARRVGHCALLGVGMLCWVTACLIVTGDPLYLQTTRPWPADSSATYHSVQVWLYVAKWPEYCGPVLIVLFILGIAPAIRKKMAVPWAIGSLVFVTHTVLWWQGWFTSAGLQRVLLPLSPIAALICLYGWNRMVKSRPLEARPMLRRVVGVALVPLATAAAMFHYVADENNHHQKLIRRAVADVQSRRLLDDAPALFTSDEIIVAALDLDLPDARWKRGLFNHEKQLAMLESLPQGTVGIWDNQRGASWYHVEIDELPRLGYEIVFDADQVLPPFRVPWFWFRSQPVYQRCVVVVRK